MRFGADPSAWHVPVAQLAFAANNFFGVPQAGADEARKVAVTMNRGTENNMIVFRASGIRSVDVVAPGQSGFIAPDGSASPHLRDQLDLYVDYRSTPVWFTPAEVQRDTRETLKLRR